MKSLAEIMKMQIHCVSKAGKEMQLIIKPLSEGAVFAEDLKEWQEAMYPENDIRIIRQ
jgi:hypothetical protein